MFYKTQAGNKLEVLESESTWNSNCKYYQFILHEKKEHGENITLLFQAHMTSPDYFIRKYCTEN